MAGTGNEIGASGLRVSAGVVEEEYLRQLQGKEAARTWRNMRDNDPLVGAILFAIDMLIRQVEWTVEKKEAKDADVEFLEQCMDDMSQSWGDVISEILSMLPFGFSVHEIVYKKRQGVQPPNSKLPSSKYSDGKVGWRKMPIRAQDTVERWQFDDQGGVTGLVQQPPPTYEEIVIPMEKMLLFRLNVYKGNPEGRSLLRNAYRPWFFKNRIEQIEGTGIERDLAGFPVLWLPAAYMADDASTEQKAVVAAFAKLGENIRRDKQEFLMMPLEYDEKGNKIYDFELMGSGGSRNFDTSAIIQRLNQHIAMTVLADFILLGHEKVGSFALSSNKTDLFGVALGTVLDSIQDVFNRYAIPRLFYLNGMDVKELPEIKHGDIEQPDLAELGTYIQTLASTGMTMFPDENLEKYLREVASLPELTDEVKAEQDAKKEQDNAAAAGGLDAGGAGGGTASAGGGQPAKGFDLSGL